MKKALFLILMCLTITVSFAQHKIMVWDSLSNKPIAYARVTCPAVEGGAYSNEAGVFILPSNFTHISINALGYNEKTIAVAQDLQRIYLTKQENKQPEKLKNFSNTDCEIGYFNEHEKSMNLSLTAGFEEGVFIPNKFNKELKVKKIILETNPLPWIIRKLANDPPSLIRINFYKANENKEIGEIINTNQLVYSSKTLKEKTIINLSKENIIIPAEGVIVGIEYLGIIRGKDKLIYTSKYDEDGEFIGGGVIFPMAKLSEKKGTTYIIRYFKNKKINVYKSFDVLKISLIAS